MSLTNPVSLAFDSFLLITFILFYLLELVSFDKLNLLDGEFDDDGSGSRYAGTYVFYFALMNQFVVLVNSLVVSVV